MDLPVVKTSIAAESSIEAAAHAEQRGKNFQLCQLRWKKIKLRKKKKGSILKQQCDTILLTVKEVGSDGAGKMRKPVITYSKVAASTPCTQMPQRQLQSTSDTAAHNQKQAIQQKEWQVVKKETN